MRRDEPLSGRNAVVGTLSVALLGAVLLHALGDLPPPSIDLRGTVAASLPQAGAEHPVTAVLLDIRSYDTLLEVGVLLLSVVGAWSLLGTSRAPVRLGADPMLDGLVATGTPPMLLVAVYLLWAGGHAPGGAFQAGALAAGAGVLLVLAGKGHALAVDRLALRVVLAAGTSVFVLVGIAPQFAGRSFLDYPEPMAKSLVLLIESVVAPSIAAALAVLFAGGSTRERRP